MSTMTLGGFTMFTASSTISNTAAISSMNTPALLIRVISLTPNALTTVVNTMRIAPQITALTAKSVSPVPSPTSWKPLQICGRVIW